MKCTRLNSIHCKPSEGKEFEQGLNTQLYSIIFIDAIIELVLCHSYQSWCLEQIPDLVSSAIDNNLTCLLIGGTICDLHVGC